MKPRQEVAVISLDLKMTDEGFIKYNALPVEDKIDLLYERMLKVCEELKKKEPNSQWIIAWREYGITDANSKFISNEMKHYLKKTMQSLTKRYPQLTIIAGTVATKKHFSAAEYKSKLSKIKKYYKQHEWIYKSENQSAVEQKLFHYKKLKELKKKKIDEGIDVIRNTTYIFSENKCVARHDKVAPYFETANVGQRWVLMDENADLTDMVNTNRVFQPGNKKNNSTRFTLKKADISMSPIDIVFEICKEHIAGVVANEEKNKKTIADLHFVLGYGATIELDKIRAKVFAAFDKNIETQLIINQEMTEEEISQLPYHLYRTNILSESGQLHGPIMPIYLQEFKILAIFDELKNLLKKRSSDLASVIVLRNMFCNFASKPANKSNYGILIPEMKECADYKKLMSTDHYSSKDINLSKDVQALLNQLFTLLEKIEPKLFPSPVH